MVGDINNTVSGTSNTVNRICCDKYRYKITPERACSLGGVFLAAFPAPLF